MSASQEVIFFDHSGTPGGGQLEALRLLPRLRSLRPRALFVTGGPISDRLSAMGVDTTVLESGREFRPWLAPYYALRTWRALRRVPRGTPIIVLSTAAAHVLAFLPRSGRPRILRLNEDMLRFSHRGWKSLLYFLWIFRRYAGFVANSRWTSTTVPASLRNVPVTIAYSLSGVSEQAKRQAPALALPTVRVACFSRSARWKGLDLAVEAVGQLVAEGRAVSLQIYGGGWQGEPAYREELRLLAEQSHAEVTFEGHIEDVMTTMAGIDIVIMPSRLPEPFGQVTVQSLAAGCLTVVSNHGGSLELIEDGLTGLTFENDNVRDLKHVLAWALDNREEATLIAEEGRSTADRLTDRALAGELEDAIARLLPRSLPDHTIAGRSARGDEHE